MFTVCLVGNTSCQELILNSDVLRRLLRGASGGAVLMAAKGTDFQ